MEKKLTYRNLVRLPDGKVVELKDLPEEQRQEIGRLLNETAMRAAGYVPSK